MFIFYFLFFIFYFLFFGSYFFPKEQCGSPVGRNAGIVEFKHIDSSPFLTF